MKGSTKIALSMIPVAVLAILFFLPSATAPSVQPAAPVHAKLIVSLPAQVTSSLSATDNNGVISFVSGTGNFNVTVEKGILNDVEVNIPSGLSDILNQQKTNTYKFGYNFTFTLPSSMTLGLKKSYNFSEDISVNSTAITSPSFQVDFSPEIANGFTVQITKELSNSAKVVMKKTFGAGSNTVYIDPTVISVSSASNALLSGWFQNRITFVNGTACIFFDNAAGSALDIFYSCSYPPFTSWSTNTYITSGASYDGSPVFDVEQNDTNVSIFYRNFSSNNFNHTLTFMKGNSLGTFTYYNPGQSQTNTEGMTHALLGKGVSIFTIAKSGDTTPAYFITNKTGTNDYNASVPINKSIGNANIEPVVTRLNDTHAIITSWNRYDSSLGALPLTSWMFNATTGTLGTPEQILAGDNYNGSTRVNYLDKIGIATIFYGNSTQKDGQNNGAIKLYEAKRSPAGVWSVVGNVSNYGLVTATDPGNKFLQNVSCASDNTTNNEFCMFVNGTGIWASNRTSDSSGNGNWNGLYLVQSRTNPAQITTFPQVVSNGTNRLMLYAWQEGSNILFDSLSVATIAPNNAPRFDYTANTTYQGTTQLTPAYAASATYTPGQNISVAYNITDPDGDNQIDTVTIQINGSNFTNRGNVINPGYFSSVLRVSNVTVGGKFFLNITAPKVGTYVGFVCANDTSNAQNCTTNFTISVLTNSSGAITGSNLNGSYANGLQGIALYVNASRFDNVTVELQNQTGIFNFTVPFNGVNGNYTLALNGSQLGLNATLGGGRINVTRFIFGGNGFGGTNNYTQNTNDSTLGFDYASTILDNLTVAPNPQTNQTGATLTFSARFDQTDNLQGVVSACHVEAFGSNFSTSYNSVSDRSQSIVSAERTPGTYSYRMICDANSSYQMQVGSGSFVISSGSGGSGGNGGSGGGGGGTGSSPVVVITNKSFTVTPQVFVIATATGGKTVTREYSILNTLSERVSLSVSFTGPYASWASGVQGIPIDAGQTHAFPINITIPDDVGVGTYDIGVKFVDDNTHLGATAQIEVQINPFSKIIEFFAGLINKMFSPIMLPVTATAPLQQIIGDSQPIDFNNLTVPFAHLGITVGTFAISFWALSTRTRIFKNKAGWSGFLSVVIALLVLIVVP